MLAAARTRPEALALSAGGRSLTHGELAAAVATAAAGLTALGIRRGDAVIVQLPNDLELVVLTLALSRLGAPPVLTPTALRDYELEHLVRIVRPVGIAIAATHARFDHLAMARRLRATHPSVRSLLVSGVADHATNESIVDLVALCAPGFGSSIPVTDTAQLDDPALCLLSSGTTGPPKVIPRLQQAYDYQLRITPDLAGVDQDSVYLAVMPATHGFVLGCPGVLGTIGVGGRVVLGHSAEPAVAFALVERERVTHCALVPALAQRWVEAAADTEHDLSSLQVLQVGGARPSRPQVERIPQTLGAVVQQCYGMSEGLLNYTALDDGDDVKFDTQGRPASPADEILVVGPDGRPVPPGGTGELLTRGPYTVAGYYADDEANASSFTVDGYYRTGDLVRVHEPSGSLVVEGRCRDVVNRGGEKIPAAELESLAAEHPDVVEVTVIGVPHERYGEIVCLYVVCREGVPAPRLREMRSFLAERGLARFKLPERVEIVARLPYLGIGKVDKKALRASVADKPGRPSSTATVN
ncbi:(2,3-dihydroxybenzoyl)adenylate synthase [Micromonospora craniellae]|uniref:(2,3-dihydroxybenzoyl)adenylate synthase n=1 Tax=Micromonospora craniellae TaxID=2294034 RepID=UPI001CC4E833|nr:AMP-binding protein [Micromonospora craniellae]